MTVEEFAPHSYGFRPRRGCKDALRRADQLLKEGYVFVVDADLMSYFDTIPHESLLARVREAGFDFLGDHFAKHRRWPNKFFHQHGLYSLSHAHQLACQSCLR